MVQIDQRGVDAPSSSPIAALDLAKLIIFKANEIKQTLIQIKVTSINGCDKRWTKTSMVGEMESISTHFELKALATVEHLLRTISKAG